MPTPKRRKDKSPQKPGKPKLSIADSLGLSSQKNGNTPITPPQIPILSFGNIPSLNLNLNDSSPLSEQLIQSLLSNAEDGEIRGLASPTPIALTPVEDGEIRDANIDNEKQKLPPNGLNGKFSRDKDVVMSDMVKANERSGDYTRATSSRSHLGSDDLDDMVPNGRPLLSRLSMNPVQDQPSTFQETAFIASPGQIHSFSGSVQSSLQEKIVGDELYRGSFPSQAANTVPSVEARGERQPQINGSFRSKPRARDQSSDMDVDSSPETPLRDLVTLTQSATSMEPMEPLQPVEPTLEAANFETHALEVDTTITNSTIDNSEIDMADASQTALDTVIEDVTPVLQVQEVISRPGLWRLERGRTKAGISYISVDITDGIAEAAINWSHAHEILLGPDVEALSVQLSCVSNDALRATEKSVSDGAPQDLLALVGNIPCMWPSNRMFGIGVAYGDTSSEVEWIPIILPALAHTLDLTQFIKPGRMTFRLIFGMGLDDFTFILFASHPSAEELQVANAQAERERDIQILMDKLQAISVPPGAAFKFPLAVSP